MVQTAVTSSGAIKGWIVDNYYVPKTALRYFSPITALKGIKVICTFDKAGIRVRGKRYPNILNVINAGNCREVLRSFIVNGISLNEVLFFPCDIKEVKSDNISGFWRVISDLPLRKYFVYKITDSSFQTLGYILFRQCLYKTKVLYINMFEVENKGKGIGTKILSMLKTFDCQISGLSTTDAISFWEKQGANFTDDFNHFTI